MIPYERRQILLQTLENSEFVSTEQLICGGGGSLRVHDPQRPEGAGG